PELRGLPVADSLPGRETLPDLQLQVANLRPADAGLRPRSRDRPPRARVAPQLLPPESMVLPCFRNGVVTPDVRLSRYLPLPPTPWKRMPMFAWVIRLPSTSTFVWDTRIPAPWPPFGVVLATSLSTTLVPMPGRMSMPMALGRVGGGPVATTWLLRTMFP